MNNSVEITTQLDKEDPIYQKKRDYLARGPQGQIGIGKYEQTFTISQDLDDEEVDKFISFCRYIVTTKKEKDNVDVSALEGKIKHQD